MYDVDDFGAHYSLSRSKHTVIFEYFNIKEQALSNLAFLSF